MGVTKTGMRLAHITQDQPETDRFQIGQVLSGATWIDGDFIQVRIDADDKIVAASCYNFDVKVALEEQNKVWMAGVGSVKDWEEACKSLQDARNV